MTQGAGLKFEGQVKPSSIEVDGYEPDLFAARYTEIPTNMQMRADYLLVTDGLPTYMGYAPRGLSASDTGWLLQKFTYDVNRQCTLRQIAYSSWDLRADGGTTYS
jgi:hypothetical protein